MNNYRILAIIIGFFAIGSVSETFRILTSDAPDIAHQRGYLSVMAILITGLLIFLTLRFWRKGKGQS